MGKGCVNNDGSFDCDCLDGYHDEHDDGVCVDIEECASYTVHQCTADSSCLEEPGSYSCPCDSGFRGDGYPGAEGCENIDECAEGTHKCSEYASCTDSEGSYTCECEGDWIVTVLSAQCAQAMNAGITIMILRPVLLFKTRLARFLSVDLTELLLLLITIFSESALVKKLVKNGEALINLRGRLETINGLCQLVSETLVLLHKLTVTTLFSPSGSQSPPRTALDQVLRPLTRNTNFLTPQPSKLDLSPWEFPSPAHFREQSRSHLVLTISKMPQSQTVLAAFQA